MLTNSQNSMHNGVAAARAHRNLAPFYNFNNNNCRFKPIWQLYDAFVLLAHCYAYAENKRKNLEKNKNAYRSTSKPTDKW